MKEKFLVIGGMGHIGFNVIKELSKRGKDVKTLIKSKKHHEKLPDNIEVVYGDITNKETLQEFFKKDKKTIYYVIMCASLQSSDEKKMNQVNIIALQNILDICTAKGMEKFIYVSTSLAVDKDGEFNPESISDSYGKIKAKGTNLVKSYSKLNKSIIVPSFIIGPDDYRINYFNKLLYKIHTGNLKSFVDMDVNLIDVRDVAYYTVEAALYGKDNGVYFLTKKRINTKILLQYFSKISKIKPINKFYSIDKLYKYESLMKKVWKLKKQSPIYDTELLNSLETKKLSIKSAEEEIDFKSRDILETLNDTLTFIKNSKDL